MNGHVANIEQAEEEDWAVGESSGSHQNEDWLRIERCFLEKEMITGKRALLKL